MVDNIDENEDTEEGERVWAKGNAAKKQRQTYPCIVQLCIHIEYERLQQSTEQELVRAPAARAVFLSNNYTATMYTSQSSAASRARRSRGLIACLLPVGNEMCII